MTLQLVERLSPHSVPVLMFALVAVVALLVPPLVTGTMPLGTAYLLTFVFLTLAVAHGVPYAAVVAVVTAPFVATVGVGYASPESLGEEAESAVVRHVAVGFLYALASACVGSVFVGAELAGAPLVQGLAVPSGAVVGGLLVGGAFATLQLWRVRTLDAALDPRTVVSTIALGVLLAASPVVAYWLFGLSAGGP